MSLLDRIRNAPLSKFAGSAGLIVMSRMAGALLTLVYTFLLARVAPPEEVGTAFAALSTGLILSVVSSLNIEMGSIRFLPLYLEHGRTAEAAGFVRSCRRVVLATCGVILIVGVPIVLLRSEWTGVDPYLISLAVAPLAANARINSRHATALGLVLQGTLPRLLIQPLLFATVLMICTLQGISLGAIEVMYMFFGSTLLTTVVQWRLIRHAMIFDKEAAPDYGPVREWLSAGVMLIPMLLMGEFMRDLIILSGTLVLSGAAVAQLGISISLISALSFALTAVDMTLSPHIARALVQTNKRRTSRLLTLAALSKLGLFAVGAPLLYVLVPYAIALMGNAYEGLQSQYLIFLCIPLAKAVFGPANLVLNVSGKRRELLWGTVVGLPLLIGAVALAGQLYGLLGATIGASAAMVAYYGIQSAACHLFTGINPTVLSFVLYRRGA
ncbi:Membrane protein involved in the export of O-antigen and teichoic acid [Jannaschia faecimaris]|uniref:Membrane protein involved in the export of O-antigen and teichoic acid n=1 Tax=Jannaschia faecimaris TaxID=1244108 RepID=A0A1H3TVI8_9RHOB|nr:hypothetical protein [Jannaschia faecimaris]SDZ54230.1 Membrane protein involved in the export of O-antigen and teichoic acid [Jannaschia faecimaris]